MDDLPPLVALRAFAIVYRTGGVRSAARELGITHSSVSRHIGELEAWLGTPLFERSAGRRSLELTPAGGQLGRTASDAFGDIARTASGLRERRRRNEVVVSTTQSFATRWLLPRLHLFNRDFPHIEISVRVDQRITDFRNDQVDLALRMGRGKWGELEAIPIMDDYLFPVTGARQMGEDVRADLTQEFAKMPLLHDLDPDASWALWKTEFGPANLDLSRGMEMTSSDLVLRAAALGQGIALARAVLAKEDLENGQLIRLSDQQIYLENAYWIVFPRNRKRPDYVTRFIAWLQDEAATENGKMKSHF